MDVKANNQKSLNSSFNNPFEILKFPSTIAVCNHLNPCHLVLVSLISEKWEDVVKYGGKRQKAVWDVYMTEDEVKIRLGFGKNNMENPQSFDMCFKEDSRLEEQVRLEGSNHIVSYHKSTDHLETSCFKALRLLCFLFPPSFYNNVILSLDSRSPVFPFRFLSQLPRGTAEQVKLYGNREVDGEDLVEFLKNVQVYNRDNNGIRHILDIDVRIRDLVTSDEIQIDNSWARITDARFLTRVSLLKLDVYCGEFGDNNFTSQDFNAFFRLWMTQDMGHGLHKVTFAIREDQKITMKEVTEGLNPHVGKPRIRDRWHLVCSHGLEGWLYPTATDLDQGWDIQNLNQWVGSILLEPNRLSFFSFPNPFTWSSFAELAQMSIGGHRKTIEVITQHRENLEKKIADDGGIEEVSAEDREFLDKFAEILETEERLVATSIETEHKLMHVWNND